MSESANNNPPPASLYAHPDPLLRRLRLLNSHGEPLLEPASNSSEISEVVVLGLLFGAEAYNMRRDDLYADVYELCRLQPHRFKCIYVSLDTSPSEMQKSLRGKNWLAMHFNDESTYGEGPALPPMFDEDFIHSAIQDDAEIKDGYVRPLSRVGLASKFAVHSIPHLAVYHIPSGRTISNHVRPAEICKDRRNATMDAWLNGEQSPHASQADISEIFSRMKYVIAIAAAYLGYLLLLRVGGEQYNLGPLFQKIFSMPDPQNQDFAQLHEL